MNALLWLVVAASVGGLVGALAARGAGWAARLVALLGGSTAAALSVVAFIPPAPDVDLESRMPELGPSDGFASSTTCRACHPGQYETWHDSFHRTMTQGASPETVVAEFDGRVLTGFGLAARVFREGDEFLVDFGPIVDGEPGPNDASLPEGPRRIVMLTGSHNMQAFWMTSATGTLEQLPFVWLIEEERWIANDNSFLQPPEDHPAEPAIWGDGCVYCHATGGPWDSEFEGLNGDTAVVELGIACERCHGPAEEHVLANSNPARRYELHLEGEGDPTIVNPKRLDHVRSASLCGHCHTACEEAVPNDEDFFAGDLLSDHLDFEAMHAKAAAASHVIDPDEMPDEDRDVVEAFWRDGRGRVAGREYDSMTLSGCYLEGEMTCITCHRVHGGDPNGQVAHDSTDRSMCQSCHQDYFADVEAHTHHPIDSAGSDCRNCHMPHTSYGLLSATRSHRMASPLATGLEGRETPNACNLCHLDQSIGWTADKLAEWYGIERPALAEDRADIPAGVVWMLRGDPVQRTIAGWHYGWEPTREASDLRAVRPAFGVLLADPYSTTRQIAGRIAVRYEGMAIDMDALSAEPQEDLMRELRDPAPSVPVETLRRLLNERIDVPASIPE